jgi:DNA-binding transcriptional regulator YiaG
MARKLSKAAAEALAATDWTAIDAMTDTDIAGQIARNRDAALDMAPDVDVRGIRRSTGMTKAEFAAAYYFSVRTVREWGGAQNGRAARRPYAPARHCSGSRGAAPSAVGFLTVPQ